MSLGLDPELAAALTILSEREREIVALRYGGDLTGPQIAELKGLSLANVQQILSRSLRQMRVALDESHAELSERRPAPAAPWRAGMRRQGPEIVDAERRDRQQRGTAHQVGHEPGGADAARLGRSDDAPPQVAAKGRARDRAVARRAATRAARGCSRSSAGIPGSKSSWVIAGRPRSC